mgnify:CR=1 FL=1
MPKAIFITGAGSGMGRAIARRFAAESRAIGLGDISRAGLEFTPVEVVAENAWRAVHGEPES